MKTGARILVVDDDPASVKNLSRTLRKEYQVSQAISGGEAIQKIRETCYDIILTDLVMEDVDGVAVLHEAKRRSPDTEVIIVTGFGSVDSAIEAIRQGAYHYLQKPFHIEEVRHVVSQALEKRRLKLQVQEMRQAIESTETGSAIIGKTEGMRRILDLVRRLGPTDVNVLITGESGTGKELVASAIHRHSERSSAKFLPINCASFAEELLANELFGHERDAYTGATSVHAGLLESADKGTIFFDEVADMPLSMQSKLLRAIEEKELIRVGGNRLIPVDVRVIAATNKDIRKLVDLGLFRQDLFYRLNVVSIHLPPLSERREDIPLLLAHALAQATRHAGNAIRGFSSQAIRILTEYAYPGNVRELMNIVERAVALCRKDWIDVEDLPSDLGETKIYRYEPRSESTKTLEEMEREYIQWILAQVGHNKTRAAQILGIDRVSLYRKLKKYELRD